MKEIDDKSWGWALATQGCGVFFAGIALVSYLLVVERQPHAQIIKEIILPLGPPLTIFAIAFFWHCLNSTSLDSNRRLGLILGGAIINSLCLFPVVCHSGGAAGIFTPIFLLIPHTTATFLRETKFRIGIVFVTVATSAAYFYAHLHGSALNVPEDQRELYAYCIIVVLLLTVLLTTLLAWCIPCKNCLQTAPTPASSS